MQSVRCYIDCLSPFFAQCNRCTLQHVHFATHALCSTCTLKPIHFATCALGNMHTLQHVHFAHFNANSAICIDPANKSARRINKTYQIARSAKTYQLDRSVLSVRSLGQFTNSKICLSVFTLSPHATLQN